MNSKANGKGELNLASQGEHRFALTQTMHLLAAKPAPLGLAALLAHKTALYGLFALTGRVARPYANGVGANSMFALARTSKGPEQTGVNR